MSNNEQKYRTAFGTAVENEIRRSELFDIDDVMSVAIDYSVRNKHSPFDTANVIHDVGYLVQIKAIQESFLHPYFNIYDEHVGTFTIKPEQEHENFTLSLIGAGKVAYAVFSKADNKLIIVPALACTRYLEDSTKEFTKLGFGSNDILVEVNDFMKRHSIENINNELLKLHGFTYNRN